MRRTVIALSVLVLTSIGLCGASAGSSPSSLKARLAQLDAQVAAEQMKMSAMPAATEEETEAVVLQGKLVKQLDMERGRIRRELDPDNEAGFLNQLDTSIGTLYDCARELKERSERENDPVYLRQADKAKLRITLLEKGKDTYLSGEKTVRQLRKELNLPAY
ncbi:hypothetical protein [Gorillibacterium sp. sgz5001074]|uniref:hypothetical protein n=1 Tax=Gorillibacterium sp. sgz5001074 TaxID=3446695 RepID=UPI003F679250